MNRGQILVAVAQMVLADLRRGVTKRFEQLGNCRVFVLQALFGGWQPDVQQTRAERRLTSNERGPPRSAGLLRVVIGEECALIGDSVNVRRAPAHHAAMVGTDVPYADIVRHDHDDVRLLGPRLSRQAASCHGFCLSVYFLWFLCMIRAERLSMRLVQSNRL